MARGEEASSRVNGVCSSRFSQPSFFVHCTSTAAVCVLLVVLLSAQRLPVADAAASKFCRCYVSCYSDCRLRHPRLFCKPLCGVVCALGGQVGGGCPGVCGEASGCVLDGEAESGAADADAAAAACVEDCRRLGKAMHG